MKKLFLLIISIVFLQFTSLAQQGWFWQNPIPHGHSYTDVHVFDSNNAIAVGENMITKTTNGGDSWSFYPLEKYTYFASMHFTDNLNGWAIGRSSVIFGIENKVYKTTNQGEDWFVVRCDTSNGWFTSIFFIDENVGWLTIEHSAGLFVQKTTDGGANWTFQNLSATNIFFLDADNGWAVGGNYPDSIYITTNGGGSWIGSHIEPFQIHSIYFTTLNEGWAVGGNYVYPIGKIIKTTNGGLDWFEQQIDSTKYFSSVYFLDSQTGWVTGDEIYKTTNGGLNWIPQTSNNYNEYNFAFTAIHFAKDNTGWCVGVNGYITKTVDGNSWIPYSNTATNAYLTSTHFVDDFTGWAAGYFGGVIIKTTNGGEDWFPQTSNSSDILRSIFFIDSNNGWAVGSFINNVDSSSTILNTKDGGGTWVHQNPPVIADYLSVFFIDQNIGWVVGGDYSDPGVIIKTTNGGAEWVIKKSNPDYGFEDVFFVNSNIGWVTGDSLYKTTDSGESWIGYEGEYDNIYFINQNTGWAINRREIQKTTNGGGDWEIQYSSSTNTFSHLNDVYFIDENCGWVVGNSDISTGEGGLILFTTNGGDNWLRQWSGTSHTLFSVYFTDSNNGWIVGGGGTILHTTNGGVSFVEENEIDEMPTDYSLSYNYPNPFNPSTKIRYSVPQASQVQIKVFDILGNEIETLVYEEKPVGTYELTWYAEGLPSGVYFYQLKAVNPSTGSGQAFIETKKMLLLK